MYNFQNLIQPAASAVQNVGHTLGDLLSSHQTVTTGPAPMNPDYISQAIARNETGGVKGDPYAYSKPSGSKAMGYDLGKYQVTGGELGSYGKQFLGVTTTPQQFLADRALQDRYMRAKIQYLQQQGLGPEGIMALHAQGMTGWGDPGIVQQKIQQANLNRSGYVTRGMQTLKGLQQSPAVAAAAQ